MRPRHLSSLRLCLVCVLLTAVALAFAGCTRDDQLEPYLIRPIPQIQQPIPPAGQSPAAAPAQRPQPTPTQVVLNGPVTVALAPEAPEEYAMPLMTALNRVDTVTAVNGIYPVRLLDQAENADTKIQFSQLARVEFPLAERVYAVVVPFDTLTDDIALEELQTRWQGIAAGDVLTAGFNPGVLSNVLGPSAARAVSREDLLGELEENTGAIGVVPFDQLDPRLKVLSVDGVNPLDNQLELEDYSLAVALEITGRGAALLYPELQGLIAPATNRSAERLTTLIMTGVTAISRGTAAAIERTSLTYPAEVISATLSAADITHISNEVPFLDDCVVMNTLNNLTLCSHTSYSATLAAVGMDIVGLSGNHVNDFGRDGAARSLRFYRQSGIPYYGSGFDEEEACEPLMWEHNGNTFAFVASLAFGPESAWATEDEPGACYYYDNKEALIALIQELAETVDVVSVELQFEEAYDTHPLLHQVAEFREMREAGADIVTGVQSHVPQAIEVYGEQDLGGSGVIAYGLGNLFFDQMWSWAVRTGMITRHTIYEGRVISTEVLSTVLEDYSRPRWATEDERAGILQEVFMAAPARPAVTQE